MKRILVSIIACSVAASAAQAQGGNEQKSGTAGASELLINPWAQSSGMANAHTAGVKGVEAIRLNVGGLSRVTNTEVVFSSTQWLKGSDVPINAIGMAQPIGENGGVLGFEVMGMNLGEFYATTVNSPDGNATFDVNYLNLGLSYSKAFSNSIFGGITVRGVSESIPNARAVGVCFDAGVQYVTSVGPREDSKNLRIGVSLRNVGPAMQFSGDGLDKRVNILTGNMAQEEITTQMPTEEMELPSQLNIGAAYDFALAEQHRLTLAGNFSSNSFTLDQFQGGLEYAFMERFMVRGGLDYQKNVFKLQTNF
ncbi:MAG: PorV/PorQ family protein, partial [Sphingobacteriales bacterium]